MAVNITTLKINGATNDAVVHCTPVKNTFEFKCGGLPNPLLPEHVKFYGYTQSLFHGGSDFGGTNKVTVNPPVSGVVTGEFEYTPNPAVNGVTSGLLSVAVTNLAGTAPVFDERALEASLPPPPVWAFTVFRHGDDTPNPDPEGYNTGS
jgi:hypothetical protein